MEYSTSLNDYFEGNKQLDDKESSHRSQKET